MPSPVERHYLIAHERNAECLAQSPGNGRPDGVTAIGAGTRYRVVADQLSAHPGGDVCELGYGSVDTVRALAALARRYVMVDVVDRTLGTPLPPSTEHVLHDLNEDFPFPDEAFDTVVAMMVIEHLFDPFHSFREAARICRKGGAIIVNLPNIASLRCRLALLAGRMPVTSSVDWFENRSWDGGHLHAFTVQDVLRTAALHGLRPTALQPVGKLLWLKRLRPSLFCHEISYVFVKD